MTYGLDLAVGDIGGRIALGGGSVGVGGGAISGSPIGRGAVGGGAIGRDGGSIDGDDEDSADDGENLCEEHHGEG